jgi:hypothetical protein
MAAPVVASTGAGATGTPNVSVPVPAGDLVVVALFGVWQGTSATPTSAAVTPPDGFEFASVHPWHGTGVDFALFWFYGHGVDSGHAVFGLNSVGGESALASMGIAVGITGGPTSGNPFSDTFRSANANSSSVSVPTFTPSGDDSLLLASYYYDDEATTTGPSGWTQDRHYNDTDAGTTFDVWSVGQTTATATGSLRFSGGSSAQRGVLIGTIRAPAPSTLTNAHVGSSTPSAFKVGSSSVSAIYMGTTKVWG